MAKEGLTARTDAKLRYARLHLQELQDSQLPGQGHDFDRAHQEAFFAQLFGAYAALLQELNDDLRCRLKAGSVSLGQLRKAMKANGPVSLTLTALYNLEQDSTSWLAQAKAMRDHVTHVGGIPLVFYAGGTDDGLVALRDPNSLEELPGHYFDTLAGWVKEMERLVATVRSSELIGMETDETLYFAAIDRNLTELQGARLNRDTLAAMEEAGGISNLLLKVMYIAIYNDYVSRCIKVFERGSVASFWYIYDTDPKRLDERAEKLRFTVSEFEPVAGKLRHIRNKTLFHIDPKGAIDSKSVWTTADLKGIDLSTVVNDAWDLLNDLQVSLGREAKYHPDVDTDLVLRATQLIEEGRIPK